MSTIVPRWTRAKIVRRGGIADTVGQRASAFTLTRIERATSALVPTEEINSEQAVPNTLSEGTEGTVPPRGRTRGARGGSGPKG